MIIGLPILSDSLKLYTQNIQLIRDYIYLLELNEGGGTLTLFLV